jgi:predicted enzyme related to lactoylglutathione lyase
MNVTSVTVGFPVADLETAAAWYQAVFGLSSPDLEPAEGVIEFQLGPVWLQLGTEPTSRTGAETVVRFGVRDAFAEHARLTALGMEIGNVESIPGAVDFFDLRDPDGNALSLYSERS